MGLFRAGRGMRAFSRHALECSLEVFWDPLGGVWNPFGVVFRLGGPLVSLTRSLLAISFALNLFGVAFSDRARKFCFQNVYQVLRQGDMNEN